MLKTYLVLGMYNHLPEGFPEAEAEAIYQSCYRPFLSVLNRFPEIQATLFFSGSLLKRLEARHPEYLMLLEEMTGRRQIELLGGGFHAPILPLVPNSDRLGQVEQLTTYLRKFFGKRPRGAWLSEFAWEPWLASTLQACGMDYTFLSEPQFAAAVGQETRFEPVVTEDQGRCITVFPATDLATLPGKPLSLEQGGETLAARGAGLGVLMMQGESIRSQWSRSGLESPDIYLERAFAWFRKNTLEIETTTPSRYLKTSRPYRRAYFPGSASRAFSTACLPSGNHEQAVQPPSLRSAVLRSAASSALYSRMHWVQLLIGQLRGDRSRKKTATEDLWRGQCGDAYWPAPSGGIVLPSVRQAAYRALMDAEQTTRSKASFKPGILRADTDFDGAKELVYQGTELNAFVHKRGGALVGMETVKSKRNVLDLYCPEPDGDRAHRHAFLDRTYLSAPGTSWAREPWKADAGTFSRHAFEELQSLANSSSLTLYREDVVGTSQARRMLGLKKTYSFHKKTARASYELSNKSDARFSFWLGVEFNVAVLPDELSALTLDGTKVDAALAHAQKGAALGEAQGFAYRCEDEARSVAVHASKKANALAAGVSAELADGVQVAQGSCLLLWWKIDLEPDGLWSMDINVSCGE